MTPTVVKFHDWPVAVSGFDDGKGRMRDIDLGKMLGVSRPRDIRKLVVRYYESGDLPETVPRDTVARGKFKGKTQEKIIVTEHWLTMEDALFITAKSDTTKANKILRLVIKVFTAALQAHEEYEFAKKSTFIRRFLAAQKCEHSTVYTGEYVEEMSRLFGVEWNGGSHPRFLGGVQVKIYKMLLSKDVYFEMKRRIPDPRHGNNLHQLLTPEARELFQKEIPKITMLAKQSKDRLEFWHRMEHEYCGTMLQLGF